MFLPRWLLRERFWLWLSAYGIVIVAVLALLLILFETALRNWLTP